MFKKILTDDVCNRAFELNSTCLRANISESCPGEFVIMLWTFELVARRIMMILRTSEIYRYAEVIRIVDLKGDGSRGYYCRQRIGL